MLVMVNYVFVCSLLDQYWASKGKKCVYFTLDLKKVIKAQYRFITAGTVTIDLLADNSIFL